MMKMLKRRAARWAPLTGTLLCTGGLLAGGCGSDDCEKTRTCPAPDDMVGDGDGDGDVTGGNGGMGGMSAILPRCPAGEISCEGTCVDPSTDVNFCGASGRCEGNSAGQTCADELHCESGICVAECEEGLISCDGECIDPLTDEEHCGATNLCHGRPDAGRVCDDGSECIEGECYGWRSARPHRVQNGFAPENASPPFVGVDGDGNVIFAFGYNNSVYSMEFDAELSLWNEATLREQESGAATIQALAVAPDGRAELVWRQAMASDEPQIWSSSYEDKTWLDHFVQQENAAEPPPVLGPTLAIFDGAGTAHVLGSANHFVGGGIASTLRAVGDDEWLFDEVRVLPGGDVGQLHVAAFGESGVLSAWWEKVGTGPDAIGSAVQVGANGWELVDPIDLTGAGAGGSINVLAAAGSPNGDAVVVWKAGSNLWSARYRDDAWSAPMALGTSTQSLPVLKLVMDDAGLATAFWLSQAGHLVASQLQADEVEWSAAFTITQDAATVDDHDLSVDGYGNVTAVWLEEDASVESVWARRFTPDTGEWSHAVVLEHHSEPAAHPRVTSNAAGKTMVVWWILGTWDMGYNRFW